MRSPDIARQVTGLFDDITPTAATSELLDHTDKIEWTSGEPGRGKDLVHRSGNHAPAAIFAEIFAPFAPEELL